MSNLSIMPGLSRLAKCQDCEKIFDIADLDDIADFQERVAAGEECPAGQCPECGALCSVHGPEPYQTAPKGTAWDLFDFDGTGILEIERIDCPEDGSEPFFSNDLDAVFHVMDRACRGKCPVARAAVVQIVESWGLRVCRPGGKSEG